MSMFRAEFGAPLSSSAVGSAPVAPAGAAAPRGGFSALFGELQAEIGDFIANGSADSASYALSTEGRVHQARARLPAVFEPGAASNGGLAIEDGEVGKTGAAAPMPFLAAIAPYAREAGRKLGVSSDIIAAHAALETGWGQHRLRQPGGGETHNVFGIKADPGWRGDITVAATTEYEAGEAQARQERFRSYPDAASAFQDFTRLLLNNPRYQGALNAGNDVRTYAEGLVRGGYATDPAYAEKLVRVAARLQSGG